MWNDLCVAARQLATQRTFTLAAVAALAIGTSATTTMFTIIHGVYFRALPFADPERIVAIATRYVDRGPGAIDNWSAPDLRDVQASARLFDHIVAADEEPVDLAHEEFAPERVTGAWVSPNVFAMTGHQPLLGRTFTAADDRSGAAPVVMLGYSVWARRYGSDPAIVGRTVRINGVASTIIGVMPEGFGFPTQSAIWQPLAMRGAAGRDDRGSRNIDVFGRVAARATLAQAQADLAQLMDRLARDFPATNANLTAFVRPFRELTTGGPIRGVFVGLMGAGTFLLLVACANIATLMLARGADRAREIAVRLSLGAKRWQVVRQLLAETLLLASVAGVAGLGLAALAVRAFQRATADSGPPYWLQTPIEAPVVAFVAVVCLGTTILCGLVPALQTSKVGLTDLLGEAGRAGAGSPRVRRWADGFVVAQLALSLTILAGAGLWMRNVYAFSQVDAGVDTSGLVVAQLNLSPGRYPNEDSRRAFYRRFGEQLASLPGLRAGIASAAPLGGASRRRVFVDGLQSVADERAAVSVVTVSPGYLETLGVSATRGRLFAPTDEVPSSSVAVVNEDLASRRLAGVEVVGRMIRLEPASPGGDATALTIVGVVPNVRQASPRQPGVDVRSAEPVLYLPYAANPIPSASILVRTRSGEAAVAGVLRDVLRGIDSDLPLAGGVVPLDEAIDQELGLLAAFASMIGFFALAAMGLAMVGVYGVTAYAVRQRTRELGVRLALGASAWHVAWVVTRRAGLQLIAGLSLGLGGALGVGMLLQGLTSGVSSRDPVTLIAVTGLMTVSACLACVVPAVRAIRLDPVVALRVE
jgi:putative ABC transport system permease protein